MGFRFLNIPVTIQPAFWLFLLIFCFDPQSSPFQMLILALVLFFSLLFHEYGHALAAQKFGRTPEITLEAFGGYASYDSRGMPEKHHFIITLCGPVFTALLIGASYYLLENRIFEVRALNYFLYCTMKLNIYWLIVNLAPLNPLDGGKILEYLLQKWLGSETGHRVSLILGNVTAAVGGIYFLVKGNYVFAYLFLFYGWRNFQMYTSEYPKQKPSAFSLYNEGIQALEKDEKMKAQLIFEKLSKSEDDYIKTRSLESLADLLDAKGEAKEAYQMLMRADLQKLNRGKWLLCKLAYNQKNYGLVERFSNEIYEIHPTFDTALLNAKSFSQLKSGAYSVGWLKTTLQFSEAKTAGFAAVLADAAFDPIREDLEFQELLRSLTKSPD